MYAMTNEELAEVFAKVKRDFFQRWDKAGEWKVAIGTPDQGFSEYEKFRGLCDKVTRTIWINPAFNPAPGAGLEVLLIHQASHAIAGQYHGVPWQFRLRRAWVKSLELHLDRHAALIQSEMDIYGRSRGKPQSWQFGQ
jgi:hypothetical protein